MSWSSKSEKEWIFCNFYFVRRKSYVTFVLSQCIVYWINVQSIHIFTYESTVLYTFFPLFLNFWKPIVYLREAWPEARDGRLICQKKFSLTFIYSYIKENRFSYFWWACQVRSLVVPLLTRQVHDYTVWFFLLFFCLACAGFNIENLVYVLGWKRFPCKV